jgi:hypothetical protein
MESMEDLKREFKDHVATLTEYKEVSILEWKEPKTNVFAVKYIMSGNILSVSGDLGTAVFKLTWNASNLESYKGINVLYFHEKLSAYCENKWDFDRELARKELVESIEYIEERDDDYYIDSDKGQTARDAVKSLRNMIQVIDNEVISLKYWRVALDVNDFYGFNNYDADCWEWLPNIGKVVPSRIKLYLIGLQMAWKQLNRESEEM